MQLNLFTIDKKANRTRKQPTLNYVFKIFVSTLKPSKTPKFHLNSEQIYLIRQRWRQSALVQSHDRLKILLPFAVLNVRIWRYIRKIERERKKRGKVSTLIYLLFHTFWLHLIVPLPLDLQQSRIYNDKTESAQEYTSLLIEQSRIESRSQVVCFVWPFVVTMTINIHYMPLIKWPYMYSDSNWYLFVAFTLYEFGGWRVPEPRILSEYMWFLYIPVSRAIWIEWAQCEFAASFISGRYSIGLYTRQPVACLVTQSLQKPQILHVWW